MAASGLTRVVAPLPVECLHELLVHTLAASKITLGRFVSSPLPVAGIGDSRAATRYRAQIVQGKTKQLIYLDMVFVQRRRVVVGMALIGLGSKPAIADERALLAKALGRIERAGVLAA
jgi:hypothetical protein